MSSSDDIINRLWLTYSHNKWPCITSSHLHHQFYYFYITQYFSPWKKMETSSIESRIMLAIERLKATLRLQLIYSCGLQRPSYNRSSPTCRARLTTQYLRQLKKVDRPGRKGAAWSDIRPTFVSISAPAWRCLRNGRSPLYEPQRAACWTTMSRELCQALSWAY